jgi:hypothetical protein
MQILSASAQTGGRDRLLIRPFPPCVLLAFLLSSLVCPLDLHAAPDVIPNFRLMDQSGRSHEFYRQHDVDTVGLVFLDCARENAQAALVTLASSPAETGTRRFAVNVNPSVTREELQVLSNAVNPGVHILLDTEQLLSRTLAATDHGDLFVVETDGWALRERGNIFTVLGVVHSEEDGNAPVSLDLEAWPQDVSYAADVAPILINRCVTCHQKGAVGPFAFSSHKKARGWADMTREVILTQQMPPWHADPHYGAFSNDRSLTPEEKRTLLSWIDQGADRGDGEDPLAALTAREPQSWRLGTPDHVLKLKEVQTIPAEGVLDYTLVEMPSGFTEDTWIRGVEIQAGNPAVVHHALVFIQYPESRKDFEPDVDGGASGFFAGFVPGGNQDAFPDGTAKLVPAGSSFLFQLHYVTTGKPETDQSSMGLYLYDGTPERRLVTRGAFNGQFEIPPGARDFPVSDDHQVWPGEVTLYSMSPHMHYRGSRFKYIAEYPSGTEEVLLSVPNYNFDWQTAYVLKKPKVLPAGTIIRCEGAFDNAATNPFNPNPADTVVFGDQTYEEMFIGYMHYSAPTGSIVRAQERWLKRRAKKQEELEKIKQRTADDDMLDKTSILGTEWTGGQFRLLFQPENVLLVNGTIKGKYEITEENRVVIDVVGEHFELDIVGLSLYSGSYELTRLNPETASS